MNQQTKEVVIRLIKEVGIELAAIVGNKLINLKTELDTQEKIQPTKTID